MQFAVGSFEQAMAVPLLKFVGCALVQTRALQTYVKRVYYPFLLRDPEIHLLDGLLCALWVHTHPTMACVPYGHSSLSVAAIIPALSALPSALATIEHLVEDSGVMPSSFRSAQSCLQAMVPLHP